MTPELWDRLKPLFEAAVEKSPADRQAFLATLEAADDVRRELKELVCAFEGEGSTLDALVVGLQSMVPSGIYSNRPGDVLLGRFQIIRWLGRGGMGDVFEALDTQLSESIALKTIRPEIAENPVVLTRFKREVQLARRLGGPNLCRIHELFISTDQEAPPIEAFLTMELLQGVTLEEEINQKGALDWPDAQKIAIEICSALEAVHAAGIIHRDLKARNIMLVPRNGVVRAVLMDFGLAQEVVRDERTETALTVPGAVVGTPSSMAPEQFSKAALTPATDIYALGVVLYQMLTGDVPFPEDDPVRAAILRSSLPKPPSLVRQSVPRRFDRVVTRCLQFDQQNRYQSASEVEKDLQKPNPIAQAVSLGKIRLGSFWVALVALCIAGLAGSLWWRSRPQPLFVPEPRAVTWYQQGVAALREGSYLRAASELQQAVKLDHRFSIAHARLAEAWAELDYSGAADHEMLMAHQEREGTTLSALDDRYIDAIQSSLAHEFLRAAAKQQIILAMLPQEQKAYGYVDLGRAQEKAGDVAAAQKSYEAAIRLNPDNPAPLVHLGILKSRHQDVSGGTEAFQAADTLYRTLNNPEGRAEVAFQIGHSANERSDSDVARKSLNECIELAARIPDQQLEIRALTQLSNAEYNSGHDDTAIRFAERAYERASAARLEYWATDASIRKATALLDLHNLPASEELLQSALGQAQQNEHAHLVANAQLMLASIRDLQGRRDEQIDLARQAMKYFDDFGFLGQANDATDLVVRGEEGKGQYLKAAQDAETYLGAARNANSPADVAAADEAVGNVYLDLERYPDALPRFEEALSITRSLGQDISYQALHCTETLWRLGRYGDAEAMLRSIPAESAKRGDIASGMELAKAGMRLSQRRFDEAYRIADRALKKAADLNPDLRFDFGRIRALSEAERGRGKDADGDATNLLDLANHSDNPIAVARAKQVQAVISLRRSLAEHTRQALQLAQSRFHELGLWESEWLSLGILAQVASEERHGDDSTRYAKSAVDILGKTEQTWSSPVFRQYLSRPDIQVAHQQLTKFRTNGD